jgi:galactose mutarotase-like enzyme
MEHYLSHQNIEIEVLEKGAELRSLKLNGVEFMWDANPAYWAKTSPILFPFVGGLKNGTYTYQNNIYKGLKHGFARDCDFNLINKDSQSLTFLLQSDEQIYADYPFLFELFLTYRILPEGIKMTYQVLNLGEETMFFSLGAHPAFATPTSTNISFSDYYLEFEQAEKALSYTVEGLLLSKNMRGGVDGAILNLKEDIFAQDALIFENLKSPKVSLKCKKSSREVSVDYKGFPYIAFWNVPQAHFVCIEPWYGLADFEDSNGKIEEKAGIQRLAANTTFEATLEIKLKL